MFERLVDSWSVKDLLQGLVAFVLYAALGFHFLSQINEGFVPTTEGVEVTDMLDALYFSVVTVSSLGYGDYRPVGLGRLLAALEVLGGLVIIALLVAKLASERTSTYTRLLYSSDSERRLKDFAQDIDDRSESLIQAHLDHNHDQRMKEVKRISLIVVNLTKYYEYQSEVGALGEGWAKKNSKRVVKAASLAAQAIAVVGKARSTTQEERIRIDRCFRHIKSAVSSISKRHPSEDILSIQQHVDGVINSYNRVRKGQVPPSNNPTEITDYIVAKVRQNLPPHPRPKNYDQFIANKLRLSRRFTRKVAEYLDGQG
jgi:hypothetical protein